MSDRYKGAILSPTAPTVTPQSAGGVYTLSQQTQYQGQGVWPQAVNYPINNSLRFRASASAYLNRTPASATNRRTWTLSFWIKFGSKIANGDVNPIVSAASSGSTATRDYLQIYENKIWIDFANNAGGSFRSNALYRDPSAWYHMVWSVDTTQATSSNRVKFYVNGSEITWGTANYPTQNYDTYFNLNTLMRIGTQTDGGNFTDAFLTEVNFIDGQALTPSSFGTTDAYGIWQPIPYTGTYGTNGFYLKFSNSGSSVSASYLVVGGGGSGGYQFGGGGGAGGFLTGTAGLNSAGTYSITVGEGGTASSGRGNNGQNSVLSGMGTAITATGGGGGGSHNATTAGNTGGSGGGGAYYLGAAGSGTSGQGNAGGANATTNGVGGGGGGAAAAGSAATGNAGAGGNGTPSSISGTLTYYAGGGGGGGNTGSVAAGGTGGGGAGGINGPGTAGTANTGGGGGGSNGDVAGAGGSGIVIVSYAGSAKFTGGTITTSGGNTIHTFTSSGTLTGTSPAIANDYSGNGNNWTPNNISLTPGSTYDSMIDVPTNTNSNTANYCVLNPLDNPSSDNSLANGNLTPSTGGASGWNGIRSTIAFPTTGKWYYEVTLTSGTTNIFLGVVTKDASGVYHDDANTFAVRMSDCALRPSGATATGTQAGYAVGDIFGVAIDCSSPTVQFYKNGSLNVTYTSPAFDPSRTYFPCFMGNAAGNAATHNYNFGQRPFSYTPPTGFLPLNTYNLPTPTILAGNQYFNAVTRNGFGSSGGSVTSLNFQPDFWWEKARSTASNHTLIDSIRGVTKEIYSNLTNAESTGSNFLVSFNSNGFTMGSNDWGTSTTLVDWVWKAGGSGGVSNTNGTITSTVSANTTAGFSIVTYTGNGSTGTVGHGLGVAPNMIIIKNRSSAVNWIVYHSSLGNTKELVLNSTAAVDTNSDWNNTSPTSTVFSLGVSGSGNGSGNNLVAYCFAAVSGYSAFGSYTGNGSSDGPFVFTGFRPRFILFKATSNVADWGIYDTSRSTYNVVNSQLDPNGSSAEYTAARDTDILSNGFKIRNSNGGMNTNGNTYIYAAFAENPFKIARGR